MAYRHYTIAVQMNTLLSCVDPAISKVFKSAKHIRSTKQSSPAIASSLANFVTDFLGIAIFFNKWTSSHFDVSSPVIGWDGMTTLGGLWRRLVQSNSNSYIYWPTTGNLYFDLTCMYGPRTMMLIRGRLLKHEVLELTGSQRIVEAFFTHDAVLCGPSQTWDCHWRWLMYLGKTLVSSVQFFPHFCISTPQRKQTERKQTGGNRQEERQTRRKAESQGDKHSTK